LTSIVWLASFPKSGNTWLRLLLANLSSEEACGINAIGTGRGLASARQWFDESCLIASGLLTHDECDRMRPAFYRHAAQRGAPQQEKAEGEQGSVCDPLRDWLLLKTHDAWTLTSLGEPLLGGADAARAAVLIVRDPRDVVASLANHNNSTFEEAAAMMGDPDSALAAKGDRQPLQLRQRLLGWSGFYRSWLDQQEVPVHLLRYEALHDDAPGTLGALLSALGTSVDRARLERAAERSAFDRLQAQEAEAGFREGPVRMATGRFFRSGRSGGWREELSEAVRARIESDHGMMMHRLGYLREGPG
jgi:aryl sulfotransferase